MFDIFNTDTGWFLLLIGVAVGFVAIIYGGDWFVNSAIWLAEITKIPKMIIGATVVSIGTSLPETIVSFLASGQGQTGLAIGNAVGSMFCNTALILAITMTASVASKIDIKQFFPKMASLILVSIVITLFSIDRVVKVWEAALLVVLFVLFMAYNLADAILINKRSVKTQKSLQSALDSGAATLPANGAGNQLGCAGGTSATGAGNQLGCAGETSANTGAGNQLSCAGETSATGADNKNVKKGTKFVKNVAAANEITATVTGTQKAKNPALMLFLFVLGAGLIAVGASFLIDSVSAMAGKLGISEQIISLTVVALGTSLPELVTALNSLKKANTEISMGNILGANIINGTMIAGGSGLIAGGLILPQQDFLSFIVTVALLLFVLAVVTIPILAKKRTYRWQGILMLVTYFGYLAFLILNSLGIIV